MSFANLQKKLNYVTLFKCQIIINFLLPPATPFFLPHQELFAQLVAKGGQSAPFIVGILLKQS